MNFETFNNELLHYITNSPTSYHASINAKDILKKNGFNELKECDKWNITKGKYYILRNDSSIIAINITSDITDGFQMAGAHTDAPCFKVKPNSLKKNENYFQVGVEIYGGPLLTTWFDRDLSLAGAIFLELTDGTFEKILIDFKRPIATTASLAIHLDREANDKKSVQKQKDIPPILGIQSKDTDTFEDYLLKQIYQEYPNIKLKKILDYDLSFYDSNPPQIIGIDNDLIAGARLDNLLSCFITLQALINSKSNSLVILNDHEECGSASTVGADGPFLKDTLLRISKNPETYSRMIANSMLVSCDNAHALHPNFPEKSEEAHAPIINKGPAIKINNNQRYATTLETAGIFTHLAKKCDTPIQKFVTRTDMPCGSTIGPLTSKNLGVKTIDIGVPTFGMHSIREIAGTQDSFYLYKIILEYMS